MGLFGAFSCLDGLVELALQVFKLALDLWDCLGERGHFHLLGGQVVDVFFYLVHECCIGMSEVYNCLPVLCCWLFKVENDFSIPTILLDPYTPWHAVCWCLQRSSRAPVKWSWNDVQELPSIPLHTLESSRYWLVSATRPCAILTSWVSVTGSPAATVKSTNSLSI